MLPRPYVGNYSGQKGHGILQQPWIIALAKLVGTFIMVLIRDMPTIKYWQNLGSTMDKAKETIPKECRIGDTCFTSLETVEGNLYTRHLKNLNNLHKDSKDLLSVIIILGKDFHGDETILYDGENKNDIGKRAHVLKNSHGRCVIGYFDEVLHEGSLWTGHRSVLSFILHKSIFLHFLNNSTIFYNRYISSEKKKNILMSSDVLCISFLQQFPMM